MARIRVHKTSFSAGEISPWLMGRHDLRAYENGAAKLTNVFVHPAGAIGRRPGLRYIDAVNGPGRLIAFEFNTEQVYLMVFNDRWLSIFRDGVRIAELVTPWTAEQLKTINWTQSADTLLVVHPSVPPKKITRSGGETWSIADWSYHTDNDRICWPYFRFSDGDVTLQASGTSGNVSLTASSDVFSPSHVGVRVRIAGKEAQITEVSSPSVARADLKEPLADTKPTAHWAEQAFSELRGWPVSICFHQDRLVIGGSRDLPDRLWMSKSGDLFNFELGDGLDDEAIEFAILSDQVNAIRNVFSGRHLQVFTSGAEWMVTGEPLTPMNVQVRRQTRIGSPVNRTVPPRDVDGATLFVPRDGPQLREFLFTDTEQAYQATDLALLANHLITDPADMDYDKSARLLHVVMEDGSMATLTVYRDEQVSAWTRQSTNGRFLRVASVGRETYVLVERQAGIFIERFDSTLNVDAGLDGSSDHALAEWSGLDHLEGQAVQVLADDALQPDAEVSSGQIVLAEPAQRLQAGLAYEHVIEPLPFAPAGTAGGQGEKFRPIAITFRLWQTRALHIDSGSGVVEVPFNRIGRQHLDVPPGSFSGDKTIRTLGWHSNDTRPLWRIAQSVPMAFTLLSVSTEMSVNG
jgi:hypothetical protein